MNSIAYPIEKPLCDEWPTHVNGVLITAVSGELIIDDWTDKKHRLAAGRFGIYRGQPSEIYVSSRYMTEFTWEVF